ncbi:DNA-binding protein, partial [Campylobacter coli]|nr:DNA-binding protein [Campylobacter coli]
MNLEIFRKKDENKEISLTSL